MTYGETITQAVYDRLSPKGVAITMALDAFRICLGGKPKNWTHAQVMRWMNLVGPT